MALNDETKKEIEHYRRSIKSNEESIETLMSNINSINVEIERLRKHIKDQKAHIERLNPRAKEKQKEETYQEQQNRKKESIRVKNFKALVEDCGFYPEYESCADDLDVLIGYKYVDSYTCDIRVRLDGEIEWINSYDEYEDITHEEAFEYTAKILDMQKYGCFNDDKKENK